SGAWVPGVLAELGAVLDPVARARPLRAHAAAARALRGAAQTLAAAIRLCDNGVMSESLSNLGGKALAIVILLFAGWILLKVVIGVVAFVFWTVIVVLAILAVVWALNRLL